VWIKTGRAVAYLTVPSWNEEQVTEESNGTCGLITDVENTRTNQCRTESYSYV
jgi:hypothetical protein